MRKNLNTEDLNELKSMISIAMESVIVGQAKKFGFTDYDNILKSNHFQNMVDETTIMLGEKISNKKRYLRQKQNRMVSK